VRKSGCPAKNNDKRHRNKGLRGGGGGGGGGGGTVGLHIHKRKLTSREGLVEGRPRCVEILKGFFNRTTEGGSTLNAPQEVIRALQNRAQEQSTIGTRHGGVVGVP